MIAVSEEQLKIVKDILNKYVPDCEVRAFGSRYKWTNKDYSDLDLAIVGDEKLGLRLIGDIKEAFQESELPFRIDVLDWHKVSDEFRGVIEEGYEVIQGVAKSRLDISKCKLTDLCFGGGSYGIAASATEYSSNLPTYLRITDIKDDGTLNLDGMKSVNDKNSDKYYLSPNDIVFARTGASTGRNYFYDGKDGELVYAGFLIKFSIDPAKVNPKYLKYYCQSKIYNDWISSFNTGSTRGNINARTLGNMPVTLLSREKQDLLVNTLSYLDDKIELNNRMNKTLEEMVQAIFKSWFVDFEFPNVNGKPYKSNGGEMIESELGLIPKGWEIKSMADICSVKDGTHASPKNVEKGYPLITTKNLMGFKLDFSNTKNISKTDFDEVNKRSNVDRFDILISMIGTVGNTYLVQNEEINFAIKNVGLIKSSSCLNYYEYIYCHLKSEKIELHIKERLAGSTQQYISLGELRKLPILMPINDNHLKFFKEITHPILNEIYKNEQEIERIESIRDTLIPKLMSGGICVSKSEGKLNEGQ